MTIEQMLNNLQVMASNNVQGNKPNYKIKSDNKLFQFCTILLIPKKNIFPKLLSIICQRVSLNIVEVFKQKQLIQIALLSEETRDL